MLWVCLKTLNLISLFGVLEVEAEPRNEKSGLYANFLIRYYSSRVIRDGMVLLTLSQGLLMNSNFHFMPQDSLVFLLSKRKQLITYANQLHNLARKYMSFRCARIDYRIIKTKNLMNESAQVFQVCLANDSKINFQINEKLQN